MAHRRRADANQKEIAEACRTVGYEVTNYHMVGWGIPDLLVTRHETKFSCFVECKKPGEELTPREEIFWDNYYGYKIVAYSGQNAMEQLRWLEDNHALRGFVGGLTP